jgi:ATP-binding cassette, subfamily C, bacterial CydC
MPAPWPPWEDQPADTGRRRFLVLDEPTAHLDPAGARALLAELVATARRSGAGVLVITHEPEGPEPFDEVLMLREGRIERHR